MRARMFICKYMYFPTWVFCFVFCGNLQRLLYNMSKQGCFFYKFSHHRECNEYSEIWSYYKEKWNTFVKLHYANFHCNVHLMGFRWVDKGNSKITEHRTILQRESPNSLLYKQTKSVNNRKTVKTVMTLTWYRHF